MTKSDSETSMSQVDRFCYQYLQLEKDLAYPDSLCLREEAPQKEIFDRLFSENALTYSPPVRFQLKILKELVRRIEESIEDWDVHEVSEGLMNALAQSLSTPIPSELVAAQQKTYVTYHLSRLESTTAKQSPDITLLEARNLISASGTTGLRTWEAALHLGQYLCSNPRMIEGKHVLELGAGTGYLAILCAKYLGAAHVVASDGSDDVINNLPESLFLNDLQGNDSVVAMDLKWGHGLVGTEDERWNNGRPVDVVLGADITYDESLLPALVGTLDDLLGMFPSAEVLVSATQRNEATLESFLAKCRLAGLKLVELAFAIPPRQEQKGPFYSDQVPIRICKVTR